MKIEYVGKGYELSEKFKDIAAKKLSKLNKYFSDEPVAKVSVILGKLTYKTEITIYYGGKILRAEEAADSPYDSLDRLIPRLDGQIRKNKIVLDKKLKNLVSIPYEAEEATSQKPLIVKKKTYFLKPMTDDEAISELELLDESFYIYIDEATMKVKVAYRRNDGNVGIIECIQNELN
ncbi:MAG: ribosome-associated translation inhibitor RaiA [Clostridiaceae bacterium]|jgi:putative sigma-54 modulation protein|nr:ribosome-associated translation inhibitor RaiA [Clostridiaceae bacterium]